VFGGWAGSGTVFFGGCSLRWRCWQSRDVSHRPAVEPLALIDRVVDVSLPDLRTLDKRCAAGQLTAVDYPRAAIAAIAETHRRVGDLRVDDGLAKRGLLVRHLVMPHMVEDGTAPQVTLQPVLRRQGGRARRSSCASIHNHGG
jgi:uncharacterized Fe-S radical SAM superfamily protein PflX